MRPSKVQPLGPAPVVASPAGCSFAEETGSWKNWSHRLKAAIVKWNPKVAWAPKDLCNCLPTFFDLQSLTSNLTEQYIGHAPRTVTGRHYVPRLAAATQGETELLKNQMALFRRAVIEPVDRELEQIARKSHDAAKEGENGEAVEEAKSC